MLHRFPSVPSHDAILILQSCFRAGQQGMRRKEKNKGEKERGRGERERSGLSLMKSQETGATGGHAAACCMWVPPVWPCHLHTALPTLSAPLWHTHWECHNIFHLLPNGDWGNSWIGNSSIETSLRFLDTVTIIKESTRIKWHFYLCRE